MTMATINTHGRVAGRGIRPWLLVPKVLAVGAYFGSLLATTVVWFAYQDGPTTPPHQHGVLIEQVSWMFRFIVVPALLMAMVMGIMLFLQHPQVFSRLRWWRVKILTLLIGVPTAHFYLSSRLSALRHAAADHLPNQAAHLQLGVGLVVVLLGSACVILLGRLKPRLGQNWAKTYRALPHHLQGAEPKNPTEPIGATAHPGPDMTEGHHP